MLSSRVQCATTLAIRLERHEASGSIFVTRRLLLLLFLQQAPLQKCLPLAYALHICQWGRGQACQARALVESKWHVIIAVSRFPLLPGNIREECLGMIRKVASGRDSVSRRLVTGPRDSRRARKLGKWALLVPVIHPMQDPMGWHCSIRTTFGHG